VIVLVALRRIGSGAWSQPDVELMKEIRGHANHRLTLES